MDGENAIIVRNLVKHYEGFTLNNISFEIPRGSVVGFVGENGAGKSTTIKAILGLIPVDSGEVELLGHRMKQDEYKEAWKEEIGVVFDECNFPLSLKVKNKILICFFIKKYFHFSRRQLRTHNNSMSILSTMIRVKKFFTERTK